MKKIRLITLLCVCFLVLLPLSGCQKASNPYFSYRGNAFSARMTGTKDNSPLSCDIYCDSGKVQKIVYLAPEALCGLTLTASGNDSFYIEKNGISLEYRYDENPFEDLFFPARLLLMEGADEASVREVQKISAGCLVTVSLPFESETVTMDLDANGFPRVLSGSHFSFEITAHASN